MKIYYLEPLGSYKTDLRSDTLWGLLCWGLRHLYGEPRLNSFIQSYLDGAPELLISSTFPYKSVNGQKIRFFPKPLLPAAIGQESTDKREKYRMRKKIKEISWLSESEFFNVLRGSLTESDIWDNLKKRRQEDDPLMTPPKRRVETLMHTTIDRIQLSTHSVPGTESESRGQLYQSPEYFWEDPDSNISEQAGTGLFFLADGDTSWLLPVLRLYRHLGIGGNRTTGKGFFTPYESEFTLPTIADSNALVNLSLYRPTERDLERLSTSDSHILRYRTEERRGKVGFLKIYQDKDHVTYFKEGSVFPADCFVGAKYIGQVYEHLGTSGVNFRVYDNGVGFFVKMKV